MNSARQKELGGGRRAAGGGRRAGTVCRIARLLTVNVLSLWLHCIITAAAVVFAINNDALQLGIIIHVIALRTDGRTDGRPRTDH